MTVGHSIAKLEIFIIFLCTMFGPFIRLEDGPVSGLTNIVETQ